MKLYLLTVQRGQSFYIVATSPDVAQNTLEKLLDIAEWWFSDDRKVVNIKLLANELRYFPEDRPFFGNKPDDLIIAPINS